jgi:2-keto-4-pentenoate hydratase/2-oxohepta-3-ene-1,7-dioic acid hydratase in catechol pathway
VSREEVFASWIDRYGRAEPKILCVGLNYRDHAAEQAIEAPSQPLFFAKVASALCADGDDILLPEQSTHVDAEAELALVIGERARFVSADDALEHVDGYTCANDVSARDLQFTDGQWFRAKSFDTFCPVGPKIVPTTDLGEAADLRILQRLNGNVLQDSRTSSLIFGVRELVAFASTIVTLERGDLILTGTPAGVGYFRDPRIALSPGDAVEVEVEGIGSLTNRVRQ